MIKEGPVVSCDGFEFMIRREKLIPESLWMCTVDAYFAAGFYQKGSILKVTKIDDKNVRFYCTNIAGDSSDSSRHEQFLLLCTPLERVVPKKRITWEIFQEVTVEVPVEATDEEITTIQSSTISEQFPGFFCGDWKEEV